MIPIFMTSGLSRNMTFMWGHGGQYVCILPSKNLIVVMTAEVNTQGEFQFGEEAFGWVDKIEKITFLNNNFCATYLN